MKLHFGLNDDGTKFVKIIDPKGRSLDFSYIEMIKELFPDKKLDTPDIDEGYSEEEKSSILELIEKINEANKEKLEDSQTDPQEDSEIDMLF